MTDDGAMTDTTQTAWTPNTGQCFTCHGATENQTDAYCAACIAEQVREQGDELAAFDAFHRYADAVARHTRPDANAIAIACQVSAATGDEIPTDIARQIPDLLRIRYGHAAWFPSAGAAFAAGGECDRLGVLRELSDWIACNYTMAPATVRKYADHLGTYLLNLPTT